VKLHLALLALSLVVCYGHCSPTTASPIDSNLNVSQVTPQIIFFDLSINTIDKGQISGILQGEDILLEAKDLETVGISIAGIGKAQTIDGKVYLSLSSLAPAILYQFDVNLLKLALTSSTDRLTEVNVRDLYSRNILPADTIFSHDSSAYLNYAVNYNRVKDIDSFSASSELGYSFGNSLVNTTITRDAKGSVSRGISSITYDDRKSLDRWAIGDSFANLGELGGNLTVGGVTVSRQFSLDPYFISTPQDATIRGAISTPSTVEVYNNGVLIRREQLNPGQFELRNVERDSGANNTTVIIRDSFGREQTIKTPFYFTSAVLQPGVSDYFISFGLKRPSLNDGGNYDSPGLRGKYRWGISNSLTAGVRLETDNKLISGGGEIAWKLPTIGEIGIGVALSDSNGFGGWAGSARYNYTQKNFSVGASVRLLSDNYVHSSLAAIDDRNRLDASIQASIKLSDTVGVAARYSKTESRNFGSGYAIGFDGSISLSSDANLSISANRSIQAGNQNNDSISANLSINLGPSNRAIVGVQQERSNPTTIVAQVEKSLVGSEDWGYRVGSRSNESATDIDANLRYQNSIGSYQLNYNRIQGLDNIGVNIAGGVIFIGGKIVPSRPLFTNSYSLVQVPGLGGVRVTVNSADVGRTNAAGDLIVTNLQPYYANLIGINLNDVPFDRRIEPTSKSIAPPVKAGAIVTFSSQRIQNVLGKVSIKSKQNIIIPKYGNLVITIGKKTFSSPLGEGGEFYLENIPVGKHPATIEYDDKECKFDFDMPKIDRPSIELPMINCVVNY
jgi:outer membrane usher protein